MAPVGAGDKERIAERLASQPEGVTAETWVTGAPQPTAADYEAEMQASRDGAWHPADTEAWFEHRFACRINMAAGHHSQSGFSMATLDLRQHIPDIQMPVLMLSGAADGLLPTNVR